MQLDEYMWDFGDPYQWMERVARSALPPMMITCAITGGAQGKESNPNLPETPEEQVEQVRGAYEAGAVSVHVHVRDPEDWSMCTGRPEDYSNVNKMIREACPDIIINNTTGGSPGLTVEQRNAPLFADPAPDMASLNLGPNMEKFTLKERVSPVPHPRPAIEYDHCFTTTYGELHHYSRLMSEKGIKPEIELYNPGQYWVLQELRDGGSIEPPFMVQYVLGVPGASFPTPSNLLSLVDELPSQCLFSVIGVGPYQLPLNLIGILLGGHVRVGMEDNIYYKRGEKLKSNAQAVSRIRRLAEELNRPIATVAQAREMLGLPQKA